MESLSIMPTPASPGMERGVPATDEKPLMIGDHKNGGEGPSPYNQLPIGPTERHVNEFTSATHASTSGNTEKEDETWRLARFVPHVSVGCLSPQLGRLLADTLKSSVAELRRDEEVRTSQ
jgi:hypothetical protein